MSAPIGCPKLSSADVLNKIKGLFGPMCGANAGGDPFCAALGQATDVRDLVNKLKSVRPDDFHTFWSTPAGQQRVALVLLIASMLKCMSSKHNRDVLRDVGALKSWVTDDLLLALAEYKPIKQGNMFSPKDVYEIQSTVDSVFCSGKRDVFMDVVLAVGGALLGALIIGIIWAAVSKRK